MRRAKPSYGEQGLASIVVVSVLIVLLTLISLGFAKIMSRSLNNSTNRQLASAATYAAQSGINDVNAYLKTYAQAHSGAGDNPWVKSDNCQDLIGNATSKGPFFSDANLGNNASLQCILLNPAPADLNYLGIPELKSQVVEMNTSAVAGALNSMMVSWRSSQGNTNVPPPGTTLPDEITWANAGRVPMLRVTLYPVPVNAANATINYLQTHARTLFLYPRAGAPLTVVNFSSITDGQILPVDCNSQGSTTPQFNGSADYQCNLIVTNLRGAVSAPDQINYFYVRLTPIYGQADIKLKANDQWGQALTFNGVQAIVDVTAKVANVSKRLQARVDISHVLSSSGGNVSALDNAIPEDSLRSATALCKRLIIHNNIFQYVTLDDTTGACGGSSVINTPPPSLTLSIQGLDGADNGVTVNSDAPNPDSPQSPVQNGTVYVETNSNVIWNIQNATACNASGGWNGYNVIGHSVISGTSFSGSTNETATNKTGYTLTCSGPGGTLPAKTVTIWPPPRVSFTSPPATAPPGGSVTFNYAVANSTVCGFTGNWTDTAPATYDGSATSGSKTTNIPASATVGSTFTYTITCKDPIGRSAQATTTLTIANPYAIMTSVHWDGPNPPFNTCGYNQVCLVGKINTESTTPWYGYFLLNDTHGAYRAMPRYGCNPNGDPSGNCTVGPNQGDLFSINPSGIITADSSEHNVNEHPAFSINYMGAGDTNTFGFQMCATNNPNVLPASPNSDSSHFCSQNIIYVHYTGGGGNGGGGPPSNCNGVIFYKDAGYNNQMGGCYGPGYSCPNMLNCGMDQSDNDQMSSLITSGYGVRVYRDGGLSGTEWCFDSNTPNVGDANDQMSSFQVLPTNCNNNPVNTPLAIDYWSVDGPHSHSECTVGPHTGQWDCAWYDTTIEDWTYCPDGVHSITACQFTWGAHGANVYCNIYADINDPTSIDSSGPNPTSTSGQGPREGWGGSGTNPIFGDPAWLKLVCRDSSGNNTSTIPGNPWGPSWGGTE